VEVCHDLETQVLSCARDAARRGATGFRASEEFLMTMKDYPPSQTPGSFNLEKIQKTIEAGAGGQ